MAIMKHNIGLSRRGLLKSAGAVTAAATLAGCGNSGEDVYYTGEPGGNDSGVITIPVDEKVYGVFMGTNCGGKCMPRAHVRNGVIKRITTDETEGLDETVNPQRRASCFKCRGRRSEIYKPDRLMYPLMQTGERGDLNGFKRVSWDEACREIAKRMKASVAKPYTGTDTYYISNSADYGKATIMAPFGGGATHFFAGHWFARKIANSIGELMPGYPTAMSYPQTSHVEMFTNNTASSSITGANCRSDMLNSENIVLWGLNPADNIVDVNVNYILLQAKERGIPITVIDTHISRTSRMLGSKHLAPIGGTDPALVCAILYHLIKLQLQESPITNGKWLNFDFIKKAIHGFLDLPNPTAADFYQTGAGYPGESDTAAMMYRVPAGASFSAFILGTETDLIMPGYNSAPSIYPDTIGYNVNSRDDAPDGVADPLYAERVPIYGQIPKTPEWAEKITGIPAQDIRDFAELLATKKRTTMYTGWGSNRTVEGEQSPWAVSTLAMILGFFGEQGKSWGTPHMNQPSYSMGSLPNLQTGLMSGTANSRTMINARRYNDKKLSFKKIMRSAHGQICAWPDLAANGGSGKSFWNDPQVKYTPNLRMFILDGFNPVNQCGDNARSIEIMKNYMDAVISIDIFMSPSAQYADFVLPGAVPTEIDSFTNIKGTFMNSPKLIDPPGECLPDQHIAENIIRYIDASRVKEVCSGKTGLEFRMEAYNAVKVATGSELTYDEFQKKGYIDISTKAGEEAIIPAYKNFKDYVNGNGGSPLSTTSGKFEIYSLALMEDYEARRWYNFDNDASRYTGYTAADLQLKDWNPAYPTEGIYSKTCSIDENAGDDVPTTPNYDTVYSPATLSDTDSKYKAKMMSARFVYPIPMYIPLIEGMHACDNSLDYTHNGIDMRHPDPLHVRSTLPYVMGNHHSIKHAHSCGDNNPLATEVFKLDGKGGSAFRGMVNGKEAGELITSGKGTMPAGEIGVYEPLEISVEDAAVLGLKTGDAILVTSPRASTLMGAHVTRAIRPGTTNMSEGAWTSLRECRITLTDGTSKTLTVDVAGSANTLSTQRPSRICQGSGYCAYSRISIQKIASVEAV